MNLRSEQARRRTLWMMVTAAVVSALGPLTTPWLWGDVEAMIEQCRAAVAAFGFFGGREGLLHQLYWLPLALLLIGIACAVYDRWALHRRLRRFLALYSTRCPIPGEAIHDLAAEAGVLSRVRVLQGETPAPAFTAGLLRPCMYLSEELPRALSPEELRATFLHELAHLRRRDPLRVAALRFLARALFWLPLVAVWANALAEEVEIAADDDAGRTEPLALAGAIVKVARITTDRIAFAVPALGDGPLVDRRVRRLLGQSLVPTVPVPLGSLVRTVMVLIALWVVVLSVVAAHTPGTMHPSARALSVRSLEVPPHPARGVE
jgi:Zn-dependent protease with chaperone function